MNINSIKFKNFKLSKKIIYSFFLILVFSLSFSYIFDSKLDLNGDNTYYYNYAKAIANGDGYSNTMGPITKPTNSWPPGYSTSLAIVMQVSQSITACKIANGVYFILSILILFNIISIITKNIELAFIISIIPLFNWWLLDFATMMMSEMLFMLSISIIILSVMKLGGKKIYYDKYFYILIITLAISYHIRTAAFAIFVGVLFYFIFTKQWKYLIYTFFSFFVLLTPWIIRNKIHGFGGSRYLSQILQSNPWRPEEGTINFLEILERMFNQSIEILTKAIPNGLFFSYNVDKGISNIQYSISIIIFIFIVFGIFRIQKFKWLFFGIIFSTFGIVSIFNGHGGSRYIVAIIPILFFLFIYGIYELINLLFIRFRFITQLSTYLPLGLLFFMSTGMTNLKKQADKKYHPAFKNYFEIAKSLKNKSPKNCVICCRKPSLFYTFAERSVFRFPRTTNDTTLIKSLVKNKTSYVILEQLGYSGTWRYLYPAIQKNQELFKIVKYKNNPDTYLLEFDNNKAIKKYKFH